jgi:hypothetical protein
MYFWPAIAASTTGTVISVAAAINPPQSVLAYEMKSNSATGAGRGQRQHDP